MDLQIKKMVTQKYYIRIDNDNDDDEMNDNNVHAW